MTDARAVIAATLRNTPWPDTEPYPDALAGDILHDLEQNGWAVVKLPEPRSAPNEPRSAPNEPLWWSDLGGVAWDLTLTDIKRIKIETLGTMRPETARALAAALLAAAHKAEAGT